MATMKEIAEKYFEQPGWKTPEERNPRPETPKTDALAGKSLTPKFTSVTVNKTQSVYFVYTSDWEAMTEHGKKRPDEDEILKALENRTLRCTRVY